MEKILINDNAYYNCIDVISEYKELFKSCTKNTRSIIKKLSLDDEEYIYAYYNEKSKKWKMKDHTYSDSQVLILTTVIDKYLSEHNYTTLVINIPCVYLFLIGTVADLRESMNISKQYKNDQFVCKSGMTKDIGRRTREHKASFDSIAGSSLCLKYLCYVDSKFISTAEAHMNSFYKNIGVQFPYKKHDELIIVDGKTLNDSIKKELGTLCDLYSGAVSNLNNVIEKKDHEIALLKSKHKEEILTLTLNYEKELASKELDVIKKYVLKQDVKQEEEKPKDIYYRYLQERIGDSKTNTSIADVFQDYNEWRVEQDMEPSTESSIHFCQQMRKHIEVKKVNVKGVSVVGLFHKKIIDS